MSEKIIRNPQGVPFALPIGEQRTIHSWYEDPTNLRIGLAPGTAVEIVGPGEDLAEGPEGQRVRVRLPDGTEIDCPALALLTERERTEPNTT
jgi:hypothetical protein